MRAISRRTFLLTTGGAVLLSACGSDSGSDGGAATTLPPGGSTGDAVLVRFFSDGVLAAGTPQRLPFGLGDANGVLTTGGPEQLEMDVLDSSGTVVTTVTVPRHSEGLVRPYWPLTVELATPGIYTASVDTAGATATSAFTISPAEQVAIPKVGDQLIAVDTPTVTDARGVTPICTREPACPLHEVTLTEALASGQPVAVLIGTPAYCQTGTCGPVLDVLLAQRGLHPDVVMVHAEIYNDPERALSSSATATSGTGTSGTGADLGEVTAAVKAYELPFEPVLYAAGADGVIRARLDSIYDGTELGAVLTNLS